MGYITVSGDSNGDLHDANMHNEKFGAIASVINGNIGRENLLYPNSEFIITAEGIHTQGWYRFASSTSGVPTANVAGNGSGDLHAPIASVIKIPFTGTFTENVSVVICKTSGYASGNNLSFVLQKASTVGGTYSNVGNVVTNDCTPSSGAFELESITLTGTTGQTIPAGHFIRLLVTNNTTGSDYPPSLTMTARMKTQHV